jgi:Fungal N-terminal domain of STAND proteins
MDFADWSGLKGLHPRIQTSYEMPVGFGFSIGDVISGLKLLRNSVEAVNNVHGSSADYASLIAELESLNTALEAASELTSEHLVNPEQRKAINSAVKACQKCVDDFLVRIAQYQQHLKRGNSGWRSCYMKIKWALCKQEDVAKLRAMLGSHTNSINVLLASYRTKEMTDLAKSLEQNQSLIQRGVEYEQVDHMSYMLQDISLQQRESFGALRQQYDRSVQAFEQVRSMLQVQQKFPPQIMLQQPVILLDACGRIAPFHLEFVDSLEAFVAVMLIRFKQAGISQEGLQKLANLEFTLRDTRRKRPIDLTKPWRSTLKPGQLIDMNVLYPTIMYRLARLSVRNRQLVWYVFALLKGYDASNEIPPNCSLLLKWEPRGFIFLKTNVSAATTSTSLVFLKPTLNPHCRTWPWSTHIPNEPHGQHNRTTALRNSNVFT